MATFLPQGGGGTKRFTPIATKRTFIRGTTWSSTPNIEPAASQAPISAIRYDKKIALGTYNDFLASTLTNDYNIEGRFLRDPNTLGYNNYLNMYWCDYSTETKKLYISLNNDNTYPIRAYSAYTTYDTFTPDTAIDSNYADVATITNQILRPIMYLENDYVVVMRFHASTRQPRLYLYKLTGTTAQQKQVIDATLPSNPTGYVGSIFHKFKFKNGKIVLAIRFTNNLAFISFDFTNNQIANLHSVWDSSVSSNFQNIFGNNSHFCFKDKNKDLYVTDSILNNYVYDCLRIVHKLTFNESTYRIDAESDSGFIEFPCYLRIFYQDLASAEQYLPKGAIFDDGEKPILITYVTGNATEAQIRCTAWEVNIQTL